MGQSLVTTSHFSNYKAASGFGGSLLILSSLDSKSFRPPSDSFSKSLAVLCVSCQALPECALGSPACEFASTVSKYHVPSRNPGFFRLTHPKRICRHIDNSLKSNAAPWCLIPALFDRKAVGSQQNHHQTLHHLVPLPTIQMSLDKSRATYTSVIICVSGHLRRCPRSKSTQQRKPAYHPNKGPSCETSHGPA